MRAWLGVVQAEHVARGVALGIAQVNHGRRAPLARMHAGDWLVYYSPHHRLGEHRALQAFTALGRLPDDGLWQADEGEFRPFRRRVDYRADARHVPLAALRRRLDLTADPHWGYLLRRGLVELTLHDLAVIHQAMTGALPPDVEAPPRPGPAVVPAALW